MEMLTVVGKGVRVAWFVEGWGDGKAVGLKQLLREMLVVVMVFMKQLVQNNVSKRKTANSKITAQLTRIIPSKQRWGNLSEHTLILLTRKQKGT